MYRDYFEQLLARERGLELDRWLELKRKIRESRAQEPPAPRTARLRRATGTLLLRLGAALIGCEDLTRSLLERRAPSRPR